jgi:predicted transcriptional regulator
MLNKRVEILFDEVEYRRLEEAARVKRQSVGSLVREAVAKYVTRPSEEERRRALEWMLAQSAGPVGSPEEIKAEILASIDEGIEKSLEAG